MSRLRYPVISGFKSGIGCIIIVLQLAPLLGYTNPGGGPLAALRALSEFLMAPATDAVAVGIIALAIVFLLPARTSRVVPPPLVALIAGTVAVQISFIGAPVLGEILTGLPTPKLPVFQLNAFPSMIKSAMVLAFLGSIDSPLTSLIADNITQTHHDSDRELVGQGIGNCLAGLTGAIPGAGATMRTVINVRSGGRTPN